jgi:murein DD-endopeptidase MepM/ murein hydrolase activator NlpD
MQKLLFFTFVLFTFLGCATTSPIRPIASTGTPGIYHRIERGQTLWRISRIYNVDLDELVRINHITDATNIETGQLIFIPYYQKQEQPSREDEHFDEFIWPLKGRVIASYGQTFHNIVNKGINIQPYRAENVKASRSGKVVFYSSDFKGFGKTIIIEHDDGFLTVYTGEFQIFTKLADKVSKGSIIAKVAPDAYLHFEIRKGHIPKNPYFYLSH